MNVLLICPVYEPYAGGGGQYFPLLVKELIKKDDVENIFVLTESHPDRKAVEKNGNIKILRYLPRRDTVQQKYWRKVASFFWTYALFNVLIPRIILKNDINLVHFTRYMRKSFFHILGKAKRKYGVKVVLDMRATLESHKPIEELCSVDCVMSNAEAVFNQVAQYIPDGIRHELVKNPVELPVLRSDDEVDVVKEKFSLTGKKYILMVGQLLERKSSKEVVDAYPVVKKKFPEIELVMAGRNMLGQYMVDKMEAHKVTYLGPVSHDDALLLTQGAELIVQPSKIEGIPRVSIESLALGKKVLLPPCAPELIRDNSDFTVKSFEPYEIAERIISIFQNDSLPDYDLANHNISSSMNHVVSLYHEL